MRDNKTVTNQPELPEEISAADGMPDRGYDLEMLPDDYYDGDIPILQDIVDGATKQYTIKDFAKLLTERRESGKPYGLFAEDVTRCRMADRPNSETILADIERKNKEDGLGNYRIPNTAISLINYSVCPKCGAVFSFKDLRTYYGSPKPDPLFKNQEDQYRQDTRMCCGGCGAYFLPEIIIFDGTVKNEVQFLCRMQTMNSIESFYLKQGKRVLSKKPENILQDTKRKAIRNDVFLEDLAPKPTLIANLLQYTPAQFALNLMDGSNREKGDVLFGTWGWR